MVPIDRVGGSMLTPRWSTPEELELDEVQGRARAALTMAPGQWLAVAPRALLNWNHSLAAFVGSQATPRWPPGVSEKLAYGGLPGGVPEDPWSGKK